MENTDLIGKTYQWNSVRYRVTEVDADNIIHAVNVLTEAHVCVLAAFVRPHLTGDNEA